VNATPPLPRTTSATNPTPAALRLLIDSLGMHATSFTQTGATCTPSGTEPFSPLSTRLLILPSLLSTKRGTINDSLTYHLCSNGIPLEAKLILEYTQDKTQLPSPVASFPLSVQLHGTIEGDSTQTLPMRLRGTLAGQAIVLPDTGLSALANSVSANYVLTLAAESSLKQQSFQQRVHLEIRLLDPSKQ
jgi:hypothetical protein